MKKPGLSLKLFPVAEEDLENIIDYISEDSIAGAEKILSKIENTINKLLEFPLMGKSFKEVKLPYKGYRYVIADDYLIFYKIESNSINIYRIIHGARDYRALL